MSLPGCSFPPTLVNRPAPFAHPRCSIHHAFNLLLLACSTMSFQSRYVLVDDSQLCSCIRVKGTHADVASSNQRGDSRYTFAVYRFISRCVVYFFFFRKRRGGRREEVVRNNVYVRWLRRPLWHFLHVRGSCVAVCDIQNLGQNQITIFSIVTAI